MYDLEKKLLPYGREPHSVIGSTSIGASIVGGVCNNSGGSLVKRGPAYTELALYAKVNKNGKLELVNELDINLGKNPVEILKNLDNITSGTVDIPTTSAPKDLIAFISAGVSKDGPENHAYIPLLIFIFCSFPAFKIISLIFLS